MKGFKSKGYIHLYTGDGKGKTTAAFGLALRALCAGKSVRIGQFVKNMKYNETRIVEKFPKVECQQFGRGCFIERQPDKEDILLAQRGWEKCQEWLSQEEVDMVILDEICIALHFGLLEEEVVVEGIRQRKPHIEVVLTGRYASKRLVEVADLVTQMQEIKHYYTQGVLSRNGIDH